MAITPEAPGQISPPNTLTGEAVGVVAAPNTLTGEAVGVVAAPNTLVGEAVGSVSAPNTLTANAAGSVSAPNTLVGEAVGSVSAPNTLTANAAGSVSAPNTLTGEAVGSVSAPNTLVGVTPAAFPRTLTPLVDMNFATKSYAQSGTPVAFDDLFTYSRASSATFTNRVAKATGGYDYFLDTDYVGDVTNLLTYSEQFDNAEWNKLNSNITANATENHLGATIADKLIVDSTVAASHYVDNAFTVSSGAVATLSIYVKAAELNWVLLYEVGNNSGFYFNIKAGLIGVIKGSGARGAFIKDAGDGWYNIGFTITAPAATVEFRLFLAEANNDNVINGDGVSGVYIWGAQLTESAKPLSYVKTLNAPVTQTFTETLRTEYDPATGEALGALIEGGSTNLALWSEDFSNAAYIKSGTTVATNAIIAPDGTLSGEKLIDDVSNGAHRILTSNGVTISTTTATTYSIYAKAAEVTEVKLTDNDLGAGIVVNLLNGEIISGTGDVKSVGNGWYKISHSKINTTGVGRIVVLLSVAGSQSYVGTNSGVYIWGAQIEALPFASSYIRTEGAAVSRSGDNLSLPSAGNFNASEYSVIAGFDVNGLSANVSLFAISDNSSSNRILSSINATDDKVRIAVKANGVETAAMIASVAVIANNAIKSTLTFSSGTEKFYVDGVIEGEDATTISPSAVTVLNIGSRNAFGFPLYGHISKFATYDKALTAQEITLL